MAMKDKVRITIDRTSAYAKVKIETLKRDVFTLNLEVEAKEVEIVDTPTATVSFVEKPPYALAARQGSRCYTLPMVV